MRTTVKGRAGAVVSICALAAALTGCGGGGSDSAKADGPATLTFWGEAEGLSKQTAAWNAAHPDIQVKFTKVTLGYPDYQKIAAAVKAGNGPCVGQTDAEHLVTFASQGLVQDITKDAAAYQNLFTAPAWKAMSPGGTTYALPLSASPNFFAYRTDLYKKYGLTPPKTWDQFIADGKKLRAANPKLTMMNYAPEDPSGFVGLVWEAGGTWYKQSGNGWQVTFASPESLKAANVLQQFVDEKLLSSVSYSDPGVWKTWDDGGTLSMTTSTWQLPIYAKSFPKSDGKWAITTVPQYAAGESSTDSGYRGVTVYKGCKNLRQAVKFAAWLGGDKAPVSALADPNSGSGLFPALKDVTPYVTDLAPKKMIPQDDAAKVITTAAGQVNTAWEFGPDYATMYQKMQTYWPKVLSGQMKVTDMLNEMQRFVVGDLKSQGINVVAG
ncbi:extracellular solute-binding protein [Actinoallomurus acanthiterrae]